MKECTRHRPIFPGDTLTGRSTVLRARNWENLPNAGIVTWHTEGHNQRDELVVDYRRTHVVAEQKRSIDG
jgi:acyl dehydratase